MANIEVKTAHLQTELPDLQPGLDSPFFETCSLHHLLTVQHSLREMVYKYNSRLRLSELHSPLSPWRAGPD